MDHLVSKLAKLEVGEDLGSQALNALLRPKPVLPCACAEKGPASAYVRACLQNVLAEYWGFLTRSTGHWPGWMQKLLRCVIITGSGSTVTGVRNDKDDATGDPVKLEEFAWNLVVIDEQLCILRQSSEEGDGTADHVPVLHVTRGIQLEALRKKDDRARYYSSDSERRMFVMGYVRPFYVDALAAMEFIAHPASVPPVLKCVADPTARRPFAYNVGAAVDASRIGCNAVQESILRSMGTNIEGIQGPPGTGKSTTIFHIINSLVPDAALVTCVQNKAVDSIAEKLATSAMTFVVFGNDKNLGPTAVRYTLKAQVERDPEVLRVAARLLRTAAIAGLFANQLRQREARRFGPAHVAYRRKLWGGMDDKARSSREKDDFVFNSPWRRWWRAFVAERSGLKELVCLWERKARELQTNLAQAKSQARAAITFRAKAALCTIDTASALLREDNQLGTPITVAIMDEAGTIPEYKMPLLAKLGVAAVVAIGDQKQLQPFSHVDDPRNTVPSGYFHRLARVLPALPMLEVQYRMHPQLCALVSATFYDGRLTTDPGIAERRIAASGGVSWVGYDDVEAEASGRARSTSKWNPTEVEIIEGFMARAGASDLLDAGKTIMVISFYKEQTRALQRMAEGYGYKPADQRFRIVTVDAAQGSEADVVILSCVRSNPKGDIGFVENRNRMCVAISRAKERLVIVGDAKTFRRRPGAWRAVCAGAVAADGVIA